MTTHDITMWAARTGATYEIAREYAAWEGVAVGHELRAAFKSSAGRRGAETRKRRRRARLAQSGSEEAR